MSSYEKPIPIDEVQQRATAKYLLDVFLPSEGLRQLNSESMSKIDDYGASEFFERFAPEYMDGSGQALLGVRSLIGSEFGYSLMEMEKIRGDDSIDTKVINVNLLNSIGREGSLAQAHVMSDEDPEQMKYGGMRVLAYAASLALSASILATQPGCVTTSKSYQNSGSSPDLVNGQPANVTLVDYAKGNEVDRSAVPAPSSEYMPDLKSIDRDDVPVASRALEVASRALEVASTPAPVVKTDGSKTERDYSPVDRKDIEMADIKSPAATGVKLYVTAAKDAGVSEPVDSAVPATIVGSPVSLEDRIFDSDGKAIKKVGDRVYNSLTDSYDRITDIDEEKGFAKHIAVNDGYRPEGEKALGSAPKPVERPGVALGEASDLEKMVEPSVLNFRGVSLELYEGDEIKGVYKTGSRKKFGKKVVRYGVIEGQLNRKGSGIFNRWNIETQEDAQYKLDQDNIDQIVLTRSGEKAVTYSVDEFVEKFSITPEAVESSEVKPTVTIAEPEGEVLTELEKREEASGEKEDRLMANIRYDRLGRGVDNDGELIEGVEMVLPVSSDYLITDDYEYLFLEGTDEQSYKAKTANGEELDGPASDYIDFDRMEEIVLEQEKRVSEGPLEKMLASIGDGSMKVVGGLAYGGKRTVEEVKDLGVDTGLTVGEYLGLTDSVEGYRNDFEVVSGTDRYRSEQTFKENVSAAWNGQRRIIGEDGSEVHYDSKDVVSNGLDTVGAVVHEGGEKIDDGVDLVARGADGLIDVTSDVAMNHIIGKQGIGGLLKKTKIPGVKHVGSFLGYVGTKADYGLNRTGDGIELVTDKLGDGVEGTVEGVGTIPVGVYDGGKGVIVGETNTETPDQYCLDLSDRPTVNEISQPNRWGRAKQGLGALVRGLFVGKAAKNPSSSSGAGPVTDAGVDIGGGIKIGGGVNN